MVSINRCIVLIPRDPSAELTARMEGWGLFRRDEIERSERLYLSFGLDPPLS
jgi:hypothetical protein